MTETEQIRRLYIHATRWTSMPPEDREDLWALQDTLREEFDTWLAETLRSEREKGWDEGHAMGGKSPYFQKPNPYRRT